MIVYLFDYQTREYCGEQRLDVSDCDPRAPGKMLIPGNATTIEPPRCGAGLLPFWLGDRWIVYEEIPDPIETDYYVNL